MGVFIPRLLAIEQSSKPKISGSVTPSRSKSKDEDKSTSKASLIVDDV